MLGDVQPFISGGVSKEISGDINILSYPGPSASQLPSSLTALGNLKVAVEEGNVQYSQNASLVDSNKGNLMMGYDASNLRAMRIRTNSGGYLMVDVSSFPDNRPFNLNQLAGTQLYGPFDLDTGTGTQYILGVSLRKSASGGSVEFGTETAPIRIDPVGTTIQPVSATDLDIRNLVKTQDEVYSVLRTDDGLVYDARDRNWTITESLTIGALPSLPAGTNIIGATKDAGPNWTPSFTANEYTTAQTDAVVIAAPGAGISIYITDIIISTSAAQTILLEEGTTTQLYKFYFAANGGTVMNFRTPRKLTANTALTITTTAGNVFLGVHYYTA